MNNNNRATIDEGGEREGNVRVQMSEQRNDRNRRNEEGREEKERKNVRQNKLIQRIQRNNDGAYTRHEKEKATDKKTNARWRRCPTQTEGTACFLRSKCGTGGWEMDNVNLVIGSEAKQQKKRNRTPFA